ncbi:hypothetical protein KQX54_001390 [Cotesia glomerata]|uniref:Uncharacterized protein n=1 Tax=Cotesia glomerata TaxID=32391 RepID=A0AAV7IHD2_COTGL|nr:hypothetical protein KQX54_001390 [Cotesia glomerata]
MRTVMKTAEAGDTFMAYDKRLWAYRGLFRNIKSANKSTAGREGERSKIRGTVRKPKTGESVAYKGVTCRGLNQGMVEAAAGERIGVLAHWRGLPRALARG